MNIDDSAERATTFDAEKSPPGDRLDGTESHYQHYRRLSLANDDRYIGKWRDESQQTKKNSSAIVDAIAGQLELTDYQKSEAHRYFTSMPDDYNEAHSTTVLALCVCGIVGRRDGRSYHPNNVRPGVDIDSHFVTLVNETNVSYKELASCWEKIRRGTK